MNVFTLGNARGLEARIADYGGIVLSLRVPDRDGERADVVLGFDDPDDYRHNPAYFGALIGRYANRIAGGRFELEGRTYALATNDGPNHLHGGRRGFDAVVWEAEPVRDAAGDGLLLRHTSPDGDEGYPGTLDVRVRYTVTESDELVVDYRATTDRATPVNLTHHSYFNLAGRPDAGDVLGHVLTVAADAFTPVGPTLVPTGEIAPVAGTPFDFRRPRPIGARIGEDHAQLRRADGYDHNYVLGRPEADGMRAAARLEDPESGRVLEVRTTEPGLQLYAGSGLEGIRGKGGRRYGRHAGVALETQHFPDSPNQPAFPSTILRPGATFRSRTVYRFGRTDG